MTVTQRDGNIVAARTRLGRAVQDLTGPRMAVYHDVTVYAPSLYAQLSDDLAGTQGDTRTPAKSLPPLWIDAVQLLGDIDRQVVKWAPIPGDTPSRLARLSFNGWRPQDSRLVSEIAAKVDAWCESIIHLLDPQAVKHISAPCPQCGKQTVYRRDSAGEQVRSPALRVVVNQGCTCQACGAFWEPTKYLFLCKLLGFDMPTGVLE
jgi:predicted RNA-binding Zn-ribbon protein involved in translation (DUF1610 family)